jgi:hypothetical protein
MALENILSHYTELETDIFFLESEYDVFKKVIFFVKLHLKKLFPLNF